MEYLRHRLMTKDDAMNLRKDILAIDSWKDGKLTALGKAKSIKNNLELTGDKKSNEVIQKLFKDNVVNTFALPKYIHNVMFSQATEGMGYGLHFDAAYMAQYRTDLSFTLFLSEPDEYEGGELCLEMPPEKKTIKLNAGEVLIYPTKYFHEVKKVTKGERVVSVG